MLVAVFQTGHKTSKMSLQWTFVATFLYSEIFMCVLLMLPFISVTRYLESSYATPSTTYDIRSHP